MTPAPAAATARAVAFRPRERRLALVTALLVGCWVLVTWVGQPLWDRARQLRLAVEGKREHLEAVERLLSQAPAIEREYQAVASYLTVINEDQAQQGFLDTLEALSRRANLQPNLKPRPIKRGERMTHLDVEVDVEGTQEQILVFLDALFGLPRLMTIEHVRIAGVPTKPNVLRTNLILQQLTPTR